MKAINKYRRKLTLAVIFTALSVGSNQAIALINITFESPEGSGYTLVGDNNGIVERSTEESLSPSHSAKITLPSTITGTGDFGKVIVDVAPGVLSLGEAAGTFSAYLPIGNSAYLPYMYFGVDTDNNASVDSFVIAFITDAPPVQFDTWQTSGIDGSTDVHVVGSRPGLGSGYSSAGTVDTLASLSQQSTGSGLWGDLDVLEVRVGAGETGGEYGPYTVYVDNISVVPEPSTYALLFGIAALGLVYYRRHKSLTGNNG